jgi:hypothetical protein
MKTYYGKIKMKAGGQQIPVSTVASSPQAATKIIEAQYGKANFIWTKHMASS